MLIKILILTLILFICAYSYASDGEIDIWTAKVDQNMGSYHMSINGLKLKKSTLLTQKYIMEKAKNLDKGFVQKILNGDTLRLSNGKKIKLWGVTIPKLKHPQQAYHYFDERLSWEFLKNIAEEKSIWLDYDTIKEDSQGTILAYIYLRNGTFLNAEIIKQGLAATEDDPSFRCFHQFKRYEQEARKARRGLWT